MKKQYQKKQMPSKKASVLKQCETASMAELKLFYRIFILEFQGYLFSSFS